jgi:hypothetical protein
MDGMTKWLLGATAVAVIGYFGLFYGSCALDTRCHLRFCYDQIWWGATWTCVTYDDDRWPRAR